MGSVAVRTAVAEGDAKVFGAEVVAGEMGGAEGGGAVDKGEVGDVFAGVGVFAADFDGLASRFGC